MSSSRPWVLVHSPLVGPRTWLGVQAALADGGITAVVPALHDDDRTPYWQQHAEAAAAALADLDAPDGIVLAGHSGAGPILPAIAEALPQRVAAFLFVDAGLPRDGASRLDLLREELPEMAQEFAAELASGGCYPEWTDADLAEQVPDAEARAAVLAEVRPRGEDFFTEPLPAPAGWDAAPCAYLQLSPGYDQPAAEARHRGWPVTALDADHFRLVADPGRVALAMRVLVDPPALRYDDRGLIPAIVQQHDTGQVLMMAWMSAETVRDTLATGETVFWSRSRGDRWHKGATSGNTQRVVAVTADCDGDTLLVSVDQQGEGACHTGARTCFHQPLSP